MGTGNIWSFSDLYGLHNVVQSTNTVVIKQLVIAQLRDFFSQDSYYHYQSDSYGFPKTVDHTDLPSDAGIHDNATTRLYIGEYFRFDGIYYPALLVKSGSMKYLPLSINRERETITYDLINVIDGYGKSKTFKTPRAFIFAGYWEGEISIDILTRGFRTRDDLQDLIFLLFSDIAHQEMEKSGVIIKEVTAGTPSESDDRNDKLYKQTITLSIRSHWKREIPVLNVCDTINICIEFADNLQNDPIVVAPNLGIKIKLDLLDAIQNL